MRKIARESITYGWQVRPVRLLMIVSFFQSAFFMWGWYAWQPYFLDLLGRPDAVWIAGVIAALVALTMIAGNSFVDWITRYCGKRTTIIIGAAGVMSGAVFMVGLVNNFYLAVTFYLISTTAFGVFGPVRQAFMHGAIPSAQRASVVSFDSMIGSTGGVGGQFGLGYLSRSEGVGPGYVVGGVLTAFAVPVLYLLRLQGHDADTIVGKAGHQAACAGQGIPAVAQHDARPRRAFPHRMRQSISRMFDHQDIAEDAPSES